MLFFVAPPFARFPLCGLRCSNSIAHTVHTEIKPKQKLNYTDLPNDRHSYEPINNFVVYI